MGNEPSFHIPYLYNFTDVSWKTQRIRFLLDVWSKDTVFGIPGDEDGGGMTVSLSFLTGKCLKSGLMPDFLLCYNLVSDYIRVFLHLLKYIAPKFRNNCS